LYLGHDVRASMPVYYGDKLRYSARIQAVNQGHRLLTLRVLAVRKAEVVLDAEMRVQALADEWKTESSHPLLHTAGPSRAVVTGASGAIGGAIALNLASRGWALLLQDRGDDKRRKALRAALKGTGVDFEFVTANLATEAGQGALAAAIASRGDVEALVHAASPGVHEPLGPLVAVNYSALKAMINAALPTMLGRQKGRVLLIGSSAMLRSQPGWEDYEGAKSMAGRLVAGLDGRHAAHGVRGLVLMPGFVSTAFSEALRGDAPSLLAQEVAAAAGEMIDAPQAAAVVLEVGGRRNGALGFLPEGARVVAGSPVADLIPASPSAAAERASPAAPVEEIVRRVLRLPHGSPLIGGGIGVTPGWDSLRQIEIILALESGLKVSFTSSELTELSSFEALLGVCQRKLPRT
jgi:short-subunit dehydrogenase